MTNSIEESSMDFFDTEIYEQSSSKESIKNIPTMYVVVEAQQADQHEFVYCKVLQVRNMRYYCKNNSDIHYDAPSHKPF